MCRDASEAWIHGASLSGCVILFKDNGILYNTFRKKFIQNESH